MIYTLTLNPALDRSAVIPGFRKGEVNRIESLRLDVGGKGVNVSKCLLALGTKSTAAAFWGGGAGETGRAMLREMGLAQIGILLEEETRSNLKIFDPHTRETTDINEPGPEILETKRKELLDALDAALQTGDMLVLSGSLPRGLSTGFYRDLILRYKKRGVVCYLDADGEPFARALEAGPDFVKPNIDELRRYTNKPLLHEADILQAAKGLLQAGAGEALVSLGSRGALFLKDGFCCKAEGLAVDVHSSVGAGDAMVAAMAHGAEAGLDDVERVRLAIAMSAASVACPGSRAPEAVEVEALRCRVRLQVQ